MGSLKYMPNSPEKHYQGRYDAPKGEIRLEIMDTHPNQTAEYSRVGQDKPQG